MTGMASYRPPGTRYRNSSNQLSKTLSCVTGWGPGRVGRLIFKSAIFLLLSRVVDPPGA